VQVQQVVLNLLQNAVDAARGSAGEVALRTAPCGEHAGCALVVVEDSGPGIPPEVQARMFEPLFTTKPDGTGLGLAIVRRIVEEHRGRIEVASEPGRGTRFAVHFPPAPSA
jgi:signal transduction histidine kinase